jgi:F-type H+-transporting ATPase subunit b
MRRFRLLLLAAVVVLVGLVGFARPSFAEEGESGSQEEIIHKAEKLAKENGANKYDAECIAILVEGGSPLDCEEAPNPLLPAWYELLYGGLAFFVVLAFLTWKGLPAVKSGLHARTERIQGDLDAAEAAKAEADTVLVQYQAQLADARQESARILEEARQAADEVKANLQAKAEADIAEMRARAAADIESAKAQAVADLRGEVTALALGAAEQVVGRNLDDATNAALVEAYIDQVGASN